MAIMGWLARTPWADRLALYAYGVYATVVYERRRRKTKREEV